MYREDYFEVTTGLVGRTGTALVIENTRNAGFGTAVDHGLSRLRIVEFVALLQSQAESGYAFFLKNDFFPLQSPKLGEFQKGLLLRGEICSLTVAVLR